MLCQVALDEAAPRCWSRASRSLRNLRDRIEGLAVISDTRVESFVLFEEPPGTPERRLLALGCADPEQRELWLGALVRHYAARDPRPVRLERALPDEVPYDQLTSWGFECRETALGYVAAPEAA